MRIDVPDARSHQSPALDHRHHFPVVGLSRSGKLLEQVHYLRAVANPATRELTDDERMRHHFAIIESLRELGVSAPQMVDPDGSVDQDHGSATRLLGIEAR